MSCDSSNKRRPILLVTLAPTVVAMIVTTGRRFTMIPTPVRKVVGLSLPVLLAAAVLATMGAAPAGARGPKKPGPPTSVSAAPIDQGTTVSWTAPVSDGGSPITGYIVTASHGGATCSTTGATTCTVTGLTNGHLYTVHVRASNIVGTSRPSVKAQVTAGQGPNCSAVGPGVDLQYCHLEDANLNGADLAGANLSNARLTSAMLNDADLNSAVLEHANLTDTSLESADLTDADLTSAYLGKADLNGADLTDATLNGANFSDTNLVNANLTGSDLNEANSNTLGNIVWGNTTCPDGTNSDNDGGTCLGNLG